VTLAKICGLTTPETVDAAVAAGADFVGFNFFAPSPRAVSPEQATALAARMPPHIGRIGLFVDADDEAIAATVPALSGIQLHGSETPQRAAAVRARFGLPVWRALGVRTRADLEAARAFRGAVDRLLFDAKAPSSSPLPGGNGVRFDWSLLTGFDPGMAWGLAGGLDAETVADAVAATGAPLVDVSSGVEDAPGEKSVAKIRAFMKAIRQ
jgi:phosphoribosylanthranilate isomerase